MIRPIAREWNGQAVDGVLYPRASCLGGCTAHNAMILVAPPDADWDAIAAETGDAQLERAEYGALLLAFGELPLSVGHPPACTGRY